MSDNPIVNIVGGALGALNPLGAVGTAAFSTKAAAQGTEAYVKSLVPKLPDLPGSVDPEDPNVRKELDAAAARERQARGRASTQFTQPGAALPDANLYRRTLLGQ